MWPVASANLTGRSFSLAAQASCVAFTVFSFLQLQYKAWQKLAVRHGYWLPRYRPQILKVRPERAITEVRRHVSLHILFF